MREANGMGPHPGIDVVVSRRTPTAAPGPARAVLKLRSWTRLPRADERRPFRTSQAGPEAAAPVGPCGPPGLVLKGPDSPALDAVQGLAAISASTLHGCHQPGEPDEVPAPLRNRASVEVPSPKSVHKNCRPGRKPDRSRGRMRAQTQPLGEPRPPGWWRPCRAKVLS